MKGATITFDGVEYECSDFSVDYGSREATATFTRKVYSMAVDIKFTMALRRFPFGPTTRHERCRLCGTPPSGRRKTFCSDECVKAWRRGDRP